VNVASTRAEVTRRRSSLRRQEAIWGYIWIAPWMVGFVVFVLGPMVASLWLSLTNYDLLSPPTYIGLKNYETALSGQDNLFWSSLGRTALYAAVVVPIGVFGSLGLAVLLNQPRRGIVAYRTFFYLPSLTPIVASALLWSWIFQPELGILNFLLRAVGIPGPPWLAAPSWAMPALIIIGLWGSIGGGRMLIFLAGLQSVPRELHEAAEIDGASAWQRFWKVTLPLLTPTLFFNLVLGVIGSFSVFSVAYIATNGGPAYATWFYVLHLFKNAFVYLQMGYASAMAWIFFAILLVFTFAQFRSARRWVHYGGEVRDDE
jgi:multiple sugar transport system permease protein